MAASSVAKTLVVATGVGVMDGVLLGVPVCAGDGVDSDVGVWLAVGAGVVPTRSGEPASANKSAAAVAPTGVTAGVMTGVMVTTAKVWVDEGANRTMSPQATSPRSMPAPMAS